MSESLPQHQVSEVFRPHLLRLLQREGELGSGRVRNSDGGHRVVTTTLLYCLEDGDFQIFSSKLMQNTGEQKY